MKRILILVVLILIISACSVSSSHNAIEVTKEYFDNYKFLNKDNVVSLEKFVSNNGYSDNDLELFKKQYTDLKYEIIGESYDGDIAIVTVSVEVYDFNDLRSRYTNLERVNYIVEMTLFENVEGHWVVNNVSDETLLKIHGLY